MSNIILNLAIALMPPNRRAWGIAMKAEYEYLGAGQDAFAFGCLGASLKENVSTLQGWVRLALITIVCSALLDICVQLDAVKSIALFDVANLPSREILVFKTGSIGAALQSMAFYVYIAALFITASTKTATLKSISDLGVKILAIKLILESIRYVSGTATHFGYSFVQGESIMWSEITSYWPILTVFLLVGVIGLGNQRRFWIVALSCAAFLLLFAFPHPSVESKVWADGFEYTINSTGIHYQEFSKDVARNVVTTPITAGKLAFFGLLAGTLEFLNRWFDKRSTQMA
jgi:hypothetical protein